MKNHFFKILFLLFASICFAQRTKIPVAQADSRFTLIAERNGLTGGYESYYFYVENNTNREYKFVVDITLDLACAGTKSFDLGVNDIVHLKPYGKFTPSIDYVHNFTGNKDCAIPEGKNYTLYRGMTYSIRNIIDVSKEKEDADAKKRVDEQTKLEEQKRLEQQKAEQLKTQQQELQRAQEQQSIQNNLNKQQQANDQYQAEQKRIADQQAAYQRQLAIQREYNAQREETINKGINDMTNLIGNYMQQNREEKERKEALQEQRAAEEQARKYQLYLIATNRINAFAQLPAKDIPLSSQEKAANIYFFIYAYNDLNNEYGATAYISNVFEIGKYKDGTRAYTTTVKNEIANLTPYSEILHGYYYSKEQAEQNRQALINTLQNNNTYINHFTYKGKPSTSPITDSAPEKQASKYGKVIEGNAPVKVDTRPTNGTAPNGQVDKFKESQAKKYGKKIE